MAKAEHSVAFDEDDKKETCNAAEEAVSSLSNGTEEPMAKAEHSVAFDEDDKKETCNAAEEAVSSLSNGTEEPMAKAEHSVADDENPQYTKKATKEVARPKARNAKGSRKSSRAQLLAFALGAPPPMNEEDEENCDTVKIESVDSDAPAPNVVDVKVDKDRIPSDAAQEKKPTMDREAETTASSGEMSGDAGATEHDFSSSDQADQTSSDGDVKVSTPEGEPRKVKTSWAALAHARREAAAADPEVAVVRQARGILNKLTDANFETLYTRFVECGIRSATQLEAVILEIFEKATTQHGFLRMYVELCVRLNSHFEKEPIEGADFRKLLVAACQRTFEQNIRGQRQVDANLCYEDRYEVELKFKTRMLGNLRFVGELLVRKLLAGKLLLAVSEELLSIGDGDSIEAAATLLTVAGPAFDRKSWVFLPRLHAIFTTMRCMSKDKAIPMRVRCILKDFIALREAGWQK
jgi:hypothetical protein